MKCPKDWQLADLLLDRLVSKQFVSSDELLGAHCEGRIEEIALKLVMDGKRRGSSNRGL